MNTDNTTDKRKWDAAYAMVRSGRPMEEILAQYAVTDEEFTEWIRDGKFAEYAASLARGFAEADAPYVWASLLNTAKSGNIPAIKLYFEIWNKNRAPAAQVYDPPDALTAMRDEIFGEEE